MPEPLSPPSPASCVLAASSQLPVVVSVGRGAELGEQVSCSSAGNAVITADLPPGRRAHAWLLIENNGQAAVSLTARQTRADGSQIALETEHGEIAAGSAKRIKIVLSADTGSEFNTAFLHQISLALSGLDDPLELILPVLIQVIDPDELFRQRFEVEPVLGQFL